MNAMCTTILPSTVAYQIENVGTDFKSCVFIPHQSDQGRYHAANRRATAAAVVVLPVAAEVPAIWKAMEPQKGPALLAIQRRRKVSFQDSNWERRRRRRRRGESEHTISNLHQADILLPSDGTSTGSPSRDRDFDRKVLVDVGGTGDEATGTQGPISQATRDDTVGFDVALVSGDVYVVQVSVQNFQSG